MRDAFSGLHPAVGFAYFAAVIVFTMIYMHPWLLLISLLASASYVCILKGVRSFLKTLAYLIPFLLLMSVFNALFNHAGVTPLFYLKNGNAITREALVYGFFASAMFASVILWFSCFNEIMTSDKLLFLFGRLSPSVSLLLSMSLRLVPRFGDKIRSIAASRAQIGLGSSEGSFIHRLKCSARILSVAVSWALEGSIISADSMKSRGYGAARRTSFSVYCFDSRDGAALTAGLILCTAVIFAVASGSIYARFYPSVILSGGSAVSILGTAAFAALCFAPHLFDLKEAYVWRHSVSAI